ncbi:phage BR0599 family protein [Candidatus Pacearchaeota archaeon]|nr:phage BR0599 family protein [Candidatus Pacearchaeota archaeon]
MAFETYELSVEGGSTIELYTLSLGSTIFRMHDSPEPTITYAGDTFSRTQVSRDPIETGQEYLEITLPGSHEFTLKFATIAPGQTATLTIQSYQRAEPSDVRVIYKGVVRAVAFTQNAAFSALSIIPINDAFSKEIPERTFQAACNNVLFDPDCKVIEGSYSFLGPISAIVNNVVTVTGLSAAKGSTWSTGGYVAYGALDYRLILEQSGDDLTLVLPFYEDVLTENVTVYAGCDHSIATCLSKFNNEINFGGCPFVPTKNIFISGLD